MNFAADLLNNPAPAEKIALLTSQGDVAYGELRQQAGRVAGFLLAQGLQPGERVLLIAEASPFWVAAYLGIALAGGVSVPLPVLSETQDCGDIIERTEPRFAFVQGQLLRRLGEGLAQCPVLVVDQLPKKYPPSVNPLPFGAVEAAAPLDLPGRPVDDDGLAVILFTSGSTARPRGVMVSHGNIRSNTRDIIASLGLAADDRIMAVLPFFYCFGTSLLHTHLKVGGSVVIDNRFLFPDKVLARLIETGCTGLAGVPSTYQILLRQSSLKRMRFPHLRKLQQAGGRLPQPFIAELEATLPAAELFIMYGQTEATARLSCIPPAERRQHPGSIGRGLASVRLRVVDQAGAPVAPGEIGEIVASGPNIALGYWRDPEATAATFRDGQLHTGDLATVDEEGFITIVDRIKDILKCGGNRVSCREVEETIHHFEGMIEAAVVGIPDDLLGEAVCLFAVHPQGEAIAAELAAYCEQHLARHLIPRRTVFLQALPKNSSGKYDKPALRRLLATSGGGGQ
jgi:acyl-CoA synthetase (AMP-forming)/AMP-acid ligase II